jgi:hypothetical protein
MARVFLVAVARRHAANAVAEQAAEVTHLLFERRRCCVGIVLGVEQQRVAALGAHVFVAAVAIGELLVAVLAEEARQRVPDPRDRAVLGEVFGAAATPAIVAARPLERVVVDVMPPQNT